MKFNFLIILLLSSFSNSLICSTYSTKEKGLIWGSAFGDAYGGPYEFRPVLPHPLTQLTKPLTSENLQELAQSVKLIDYKISASPYGPWINQADKGTITDDTRHKIIFWEAYSSDSSKLLSHKIAETYIQFYQKNSDYKKWLNEYVKPAFYKVNPKDSRGLPTSRLWGGISTSAGQMIYLPLAIIFSKNPVVAYNKTYEANIFDNGPALDFTSSLVAGLSYALNEKVNFYDFLNKMKQTDPLGYSQVPYVERQVNKSIDLALRLVDESKGSPKKLYALLEANLNALYWWEADVAFIAPLAFIALARNYPLASFAIAKDFGHDVDSYCQTIGAILGALYGEKIFDSKDLDLVKDHINQNYDGAFEAFL